MSDPSRVFRRLSERRRPPLRRRIRRHRVPLLLCALALVANGWLQLGALPLQRLDQMVLDQLFRHRWPVPREPAIVYIEISEDSIRHLGRWPWPRRYHAALTQALHTWGAKAVVFDILFSEPSTPLDDGALVEAIAQSSAVYLPLLQEIRDGRPVLIRPLPELERACRGTGHINTLPDRDGIIRRIQPFLRADGQEVPHLALRVAFDLLGRKLPPPDRLPFPVDPEGQLLINWAGRWTQAFQHRSYIDVLRSFEAFRHGRKPLLPPEDFRDKICLVGLTAAGHTDTKPIPLEPVYPSLGIHANVINSFLTERFVAPASQQVNTLSLLLLGLLAYLAFTFLRPAEASVACAVLSCAWAAVVWAIFCGYDTWVSAAHPVVSVATVSLVWVVNTQVTGERERRRLSTLATRDGLTGLYVIRHFRLLLNAAAEEAHRQRVGLSVLMIDIDHFKEVNDTYGHEAGDRVLKQISQLLQGSLRETDDAGRYGGEELIAMLPGTDLRDAVELAEKIRQTVAEGTSNASEGSVVPVTVSIGVGALHPGEVVPDSMVHRADEALYRAKGQGRNRVVSE